MGFYWQNRMGGGHGRPFACLFARALIIELIVVFFALTRHYRPVARTGAASAPGRSPS